MSAVPLFLLLIAFVAGAAPAAAQEQRLDAAIRALTEPAMLDAVRRNARIGAMIVAGEEPVHGALAVRRVAAGEDPVLGVFLRISNPGVLDEVRALGGDIGVVVEDLVTARVPIGVLAQLGALAGIERVEAAHVLRAEHDSSMKAIHVEELRQVVNGQWQGATGRGAIVGIYDTGLDLLHSAFIDGAGKTRVLGVWDQTITAMPPTGFARGHYCSQTSIQQLIDSNGTTGCPQRDTFGHGTHVAGTAAGDGSTSSGAPIRYAGVAPEADLLIVNGGPGIFFEDLIIDGLTWMRAEARRLGKPAVANLSLGGQFGAHDGTRLYERMIDALSGAGFVIVISAGNNGVNNNTTPPISGRLIHGRGTPTATQTVEFNIEIPIYTPNTDPCTGNFVSITMWYEAVDQLRIEIERPAGTRATANRGETVTQVDANGRIRIDNGTSGPNAENGDIEVAIALDGCGGSGVPQSGTWRIRVTPVQPGSGQAYDLWISSSAGALPAGTTGFDNRFVVASPGNARRAITVGAFVTRLCWPSTGASGQTCYTQREELGDLARFSSGGPTRDGRMKPEITAPGLGIMSALSRNAGTPSLRIAPEGEHSVREGTSMSAPHVTGVIALLLQVDPVLTPEDVKGSLTGTAGNDAFTSRVYGGGTGAQPRDWWGAGKLNARDALLSLSDGAPATLAMAATAAPPKTTFLAKRGQRLPLLRLGLQSRGLEAIDVLAIGFDLEGEDPEARLLLLHDVNGNGVDANDPIVGAAAVPLAGVTRRVVVSPQALRVFPFSETPIFVAIELSGRAPNGGTFSARLVPQTIRTLGVRSGEANRIDPAITPVTSGAVEITVLLPDQLLSFSANPVRAEEVVLNFGRAPEIASVYTVTGRLVIDLCGRIQPSCGEPGDRGTRLAWDLTNQAGEKVAPGVYLVIFRVAGETFREKLMVLRPGDSPDRPES